MEMTMVSGKLIVFEGADCVGKSTFSKRLYSDYEAQGAKIVRTCFPGDISGTLGAMVYDLHHYKDKFNISTLNPKSLQMLHVAAHIDLIESWIVPWLKDGTTVILDRFWTSTWVYGTAYGIDPNFMSRLIKLEIDIWGKVRPDLMIIVDAEKPYEKDSHKTEKWQEIRQRYLNLHTSWPLTFAYAGFPTRVIENVEEETAYTRVLDLLAYYGLVPETSGFRDSARLMKLWNILKTGELDV